MDSEDDDTSIATDISMISEKTMASHELIILSIDLKIEKYHPSKEKME